jgi:hypothetical protein
VGIGTTSPAGKLDINQAGGQLRLSGGTIAGGVWTSATGHLYLADWSTGTKGLIINMSSGNVGIGTTSPDHLLQIHSSNNPTLSVGKGNSNTSGQSSLLFNAGDGSAFNGFWIRYFKTTATDRFGFIDGGGIERLSILNGGNVGVGTITPLSKLQIADGPGGEQLRISRGSGEVRFVQEMGLDNLYLYNKDASKLYMFWKENGNVGIGTNVPQSTLDVSGRIKAGKGPLFVDWTYEQNWGGNAYKWAGYIGFNAFRNDNDPKDSYYGSNIYTDKAVFEGSGNGFRWLYRKTPIGINDASSQQTLTELMRVDRDGNVGIGISNPQARLEIAGSNRIAVGTTYADNTIDQENGYTRSSFGSNAYWDPVNNIWKVSQIGANDFSAMIHPNGDGLAFITAPSTGNVTRSLTNSQFMAFERMRINSNGSVGIGTTDPGSFKLAVNGKTWSTEVQVAVTRPPDYVFEPTYDLKPLSEIETYIKENKHLPEVPSAKEMEKNGVQLGEMNMLLLKKVEELTLYVIEHQKQITDLKKTNDLLLMKIKN